MTMRAPAEILFPQWVTLSERYRVIFRERRSTGHNQQFENRVSVDIGDALGTAYTVSFDQELNGQECFFHWHGHGAERIRVGFGERLFAVRTTETAQAISVFSKALTINLARLASHCFYSVFYHHHIATFYYERALFINAKVTI
jgi:hypothetical protein